MYFRQHHLHVGDPITHIPSVVPSEVAKLLRSILNISSVTDLLLTYLLRSSSGIFAQLIACLANHSFSEWHCPILVSASK
jgi:hypothetical protein